MSLSMRLRAIKTEMPPLRSSLSKTAAAAEYVRLGAVDIRE